VRNHPLRTTSPYFWMGVAWTQGSQLWLGSKRLRLSGYWKPQLVTTPNSGPLLNLNRLLEVLTRNEAELMVVGGSLNLDNRRRTL
jgi:hypothetical protein